MPRVSSRRRRKSPAKLAAKLLAVRTQLNESQGGMLVRLKIESEFERDYVSKWERGLLEPPLFVLCAYAEAANVWLEVLVKDELDLPENLPCKKKSIGIMNTGT
jgi:transcriptional regulator with XRE-family HTH domain